MTCDGKRTIFHDVRHAKYHSGRYKSHKDHRTLDKAQQVKSSSNLVKVLVVASLDLHMQLAVARTIAWSLVVPLVASECLPCLDRLLLRLVGRLANIDTQWWEGMVPAVDGEEVARFLHIGEQEGAVPPYERIVPYTRWTDQDCVR